MKVLIATHHFYDLTGSETFAYTVAHSLVLKGCKVTIYSPYIGGIITEKATRLGIPVFNNLEKTKDERFDVIHVSHNLVAVELRLQFPHTPIVFLSHGVIPFLEQPPPFDLNISKYLAVSEEVKENLLCKGISNNNITIFRNIINTDRFRPYGKINSKPKTVLLNSRRIDKQSLFIIEEACKRMNLELRRIGDADNIHWDVEEHINQVDICISLGRGILEAMSCGRAALVFDYNGGDGLVTSENIDEIQKCNFSGRKFKKRFGVEGLVQEITGYDQEMGAVNRNIIEDKFSATKNVESLIGIYEEVINTFEEKHIDFSVLKGFVNFITETRGYSSEIQRRNYEGVLKEKQEAIDRLVFGLEEKERVIGLLKSDLERKEEAISALNEGIRQKDLMISESREVFSEKTRELEDLRQNLLQKEAIVFHLESAIRDKDVHISHLEGMVSEKEAEAGGLRAGLAERDGETGNLQETINQKAIQISHLESVGWEREATLNHIYNSHGWKALLAYYRARDRVLPVGTRRRKFAISIFKLLLTSRQISGKTNVIGGILLRPKDNCLATPAEGLSERGRDETRIVDSALSAASLPITQSLPCLKKPAMTRKRILLVSYYCPTRSHAGGLRILDIYRLIKAKFPDVGLDLYTCRCPEIDGSYKDVEDIYDNIYYSTTDELTVSDLLNQCQIRPSYHVIDLQFHQSARHIDEFRTLGAKILFTPMESLARSQFIGAKEAFHRTHRLSLKAMVAGVMEATNELKICLKADEVICVSRSDAAFLRTISLSKKIKYFETGISSIEFQDALDNLSLELTPENKENTILFVAYFGSETNVVALEWYLENVHPLIKIRVPGYILRVVGRGDLSVFRNYREDSIDFVGEVASIGPYIDKAKVGIAPALGGAGFRGKVNQYAIFGVPSVVSRIAAKGLAYENEIDIFIAEKPEDFAERCILLLMDNEINKKIGQKARQTAFLNYSWESKLDVIKQTYGLDSDILMNKTKVTALVPSFNHGRYLRERIESVLKQTYPNVELIVIDDCSEDNSDDVIKALQAQYGFKFIRNARNSGTPFAAWERILSLGTGEYIWICESDDYADHRFLEVTVNALMNNKGAVVAYCDSWIVDEQGRKVDHTDTYFHEIWREFRWDQDFVRAGASELNDFQLRGQTVPNMSSALFTSRAFKQAYHPFLKNFKLTGDWLFVGRILRYGSVVFCKQTLNYFRRHEVTSRVRVNSARSQAEFILTKYILFRATGQPVREFASVMSTDAVRFLYEPAGFFDVLRALFNISVLKTLQCGASLAASLAMNGHFVKKFCQRYKLVKGSG